MFKVKNKNKLIKSLILFTFISILFLWNCDQPKPILTVTAESVIGEPIKIKGIGLSSGELYSISARKRDEYGRIWHSEAFFIADMSGQIDLSRDKPLKGSYSNLDAFGLFWSMTMEAVTDNWKAPIPKNYSEFTFVLKMNQDTLSISLMKQWIIPQEIEFEVFKGNIEAEVFKSTNFNDPQPAILFLGGSGGGLSWAKRQAAFFAAQGYISMALAYFNAGELPKHLAQIPLEYIEKALQYLMNREDTDSSKLGIMGYSKGAELALLLASKTPEIKCVVAIAPGSAVFQGFKPPKYPTISSWTKEGKDLPFVPNAYDKKFFETYDGMYLWYQTLTQYIKFEKAAIPVENINGDILFISGVKDKIWPATFMAEQMIARLHVAEFAHSYDHIAFPNAGHGIAEPPGLPTTKLPERMGGTALGNAQARELGWKEITDFFDRALMPSTK